MLFEVGEVVFFVSGFSVVCPEYSLLPKGSGVGRGDHLLALVGVM